MDLRLYPLDKQVCVLQIASCKFKKKTVKPVKDFLENVKSSICVQRFDLKMSLWETNK